MNRTDELASTTIDQDWREELRFPLMQDTLASTILAVPSEEVSVGIYDLINLRVGRQIYTAKQMAAARKRYKALVSSLGF